LDLEDANAAWVTASRGSQISIALSRPITFLPPTLGTGGTMELVIIGGTGRTILLQTSTDLIDWQPLKTIVLPGSSYRVSEPRPPFPPQKFYRAILSP
jgi:hypothetical protein